MSEKEAPPSSSKLRRLRRIRDAEKYGAKPILNGRLGLNTFSKYYGKKGKDITAADVERKREEAKSLRNSKKPSPKPAPSVQPAPAADTGPVYYGPERPSPYYEESLEEFIARKGGFKIVPPPQALATNAPIPVQPAVVELKTQKSWAEQVEEAEANPVPEIDPKAFHGTRGIRDDELTTLFDGSERDFIEEMVEAQLRAEEKKRDKAKQPHYEEILAKTTLNLSAPVFQPRLPQTS